MSCPTFRRAWGSAAGQVRVAGVLLLAAAVGVVVPASAEQGPSLANCDLRQSGTKMVCEKPANDCVNGWVTNYENCINDTTNDRVPPKSIVNWVQDPTNGKLRLVPDLCPTYTQYKCTCTPMGDICAPGSRCQRGEVIGTVEIEGGSLKLARCRPVAPTPAPVGPLSVE